MTGKTQPLSPARAGVGSAVVYDSGTGKTQVLAHGAAVTSTLPPASVWNADGVASAAFGGYSTSPTGTLHADGVSYVTFTTPPSVWNADGKASVSFTGAAITSHLNADGLAAAQWTTQSAKAGALHADGAASASWIGIAAANAVWHADGTATGSFFDARGIGALEADGVANVAFSARAIANAALEADGSSWVAFSVEAPGPFYFAWINYSEVWGPQHLRIDEVVFSCNLVHEEGQCATLELVVKNPFSGFLAFGRLQWCYFSLSSGPLFKGRLVSLPSDMTGETITYHFTAMPLNMLDQQRTLADAMMVLPYWDPVWVAEAQRLDPQSVLEGYSRHWCVDRVTLQVTTSDLITGEDGVVTFSENDVFYDSVKPTIDKAPLLNVYVDATVNWTQYCAGTIEMGYRSWSAWSAGGILGSWPKAGTQVGSGWFVKHSGAWDPAVEVKTQNYGGKLTYKGEVQDPFRVIYDANGFPHADPIYVHKFDDLLEFNYNISRPYLIGHSFSGSPGETTVLASGSPGTTFVTSQSLNIQIGDEALGVPSNSSASQAGICIFNWSVMTKLTLGYLAQRQRTENVKFTLAANMQPIFSNPAEAGASGVAANFAQNSEYMQLTGSVGLEGPYGNFRGNWQPSTQYYQYDIFIVVQGPDTYAFQAQKDHVSLPFFDSNACAQLYVAGYYDAGDLVYSGGNYFQVLISGNYNGQPPPTITIPISGQSVTMILDPFSQQPSLVPTGDPHAGKRLYQAVPQFRGNWIANGEVYVAGDMTIAPDGTWYRVAIGHRSAATFYRFAIDPTGRLLYELMLNPPPIGDLKRASYFPTSRGNQSLQNLIYRARAKILGRARVLKIEFECHYETVMSSITLRKNVQLFDRRLPGGSVIGKVVAYGFKGVGDTGQLIGSVTIACTAGYANAVTPVTGTPDYVTSDYVGSDYQFFYGAVTVLGTSDVSYQPPGDVGSQVDDGLQFPLSKGTAVVSEGQATLGGFFLG